jgi:hypothetical protein
MLRGIYSEKVCFGESFLRMCVVGFESGSLCFANILKVNFLCESRFHSTPIKLGHRNFLNNSGIFVVDNDLENFVD